MRNEGYDTALICLNGHKINACFHAYPEFNTNYCDKCGAKTIFKCQKCTVEIRGFYSDGFPVNYKVPSYCHACGHPYPWTEEKLKAIKEVIQLSEISEQEKEDFNESLPDIISETPRTKVAALKVKIIGAKVRKEVWTVVKDIFIDIASETAKKAMGL